MVNGLAANPKLERQLLALKTDIKWQNGLMKKPKSTTLTNL